jgi:type 1 glutamine amidotransferase
MHRRDLLVGSSAALALGMSPLRAWAAQAAGPKRRLLYFTKSSGFQHSAVKRKGDQLSHSEKVLSEVGPKHNWEVTCTKDGGLITAKHLAAYDAILFYTSGNLTKTGTDKQPAISPEGIEALFAAVRGGKGFVGFHAATDTFRGGKTPHPYIQMIGGEFVKHGPQQKAKMTCVDPAFPGLAGAKGGFELHEEWYALKRFAKDMHVLLVQETAGMKGDCYQRPPFPATWARMHGKGRVYYTSMGHREDVWTNPLVQEILVGGIAWAVGNVAKADVTPNLQQAAPRADEMSGTK